jgi:hypothetical protein
MPNPFSPFLEKETGKPANIAELELQKKQLS